MDEESEMRQIRFRTSTILMLTAILASLLAFRRLKPAVDFLSLAPFDVLTILLAVILVTFCLMLQALRRK